MTTQNDEEVKETSEDEDKDLTAEDLDDPDSTEVAKGAVVEDPENEPEEEEKETLDESSDDDKPAEETESSDKDDAPGTEGEESTSVEPEKKVPAPVVGESPKERALRLEVTRVKQKLRTERGTKLFKDADATLATPASGDALSEEEKKTLEQFDPDQVANMEKLIAISAKKMGFVKKDEFSKSTYQEKSQEILDSFLEAHPELDEENDKDNILWKQFQQNIKIYRPPTNPKDWQEIFKKAHKEIFGIQTDDKDLKKIAAQQEKTKVASHAAAASKTNSKSHSKSPVVDAELKDLVKSGALRGFSDEELKEMGLD